VFPVVQVAGNVPLSVAVLSYAGQLNIGIQSDPDGLPDLDVFADGLCRSLEELGAATPPLPDWAERAGETSERGFRLLGVKAGHTRRRGHRPVNRRRLGRPGVQHGILRLSVLAAAEHLVAHRDAGDPLADLVDHTGGVIAEVPAADHGLAPDRAPEMVFQSIGFTLAARTAIRICPGPACESGASVHSRTSGPP
jgi:hypothetical protein